MRIRRVKNFFKWAVVILSLILLYLVVEIGITLVKNMDMLGGLGDSSNWIFSFTRIFLSIIMEGFPFIMIGAFVSSLIHLYVSEKTIKKLIPKNNLKGILMAGLVGLIFPVCECAIVPIARRLIKKGVPLHIAITFMITVPVVNPIVMVSTYYAFSSLSTAVLRSVLAYGGACLIGIILLIMNEKRPFKQIKPKKFNKSGVKIKIQHNEECGCSFCGGEHDHEHHHEHHHGGRSSRIKAVINHTSEELLTIGKYFIIGAAISSAFQVVVSKTLLSSFGGGGVVSILLMIFIAFMLSLCSEADAFIANAFSESFTSGSVMAFMILGPMIDLKNTMMLAGYFNRRFIAKLVFVIAAVVFMIGCIINLMGGIML